VSVAGDVDTTTLTAMFDKMMEVAKEHGAKAPDTSAKNKSSVEMKGSATKTVVKEAALEIFGDQEDLSEEFKERTAVLFEAAVEARVIEERMALEEAFEAALEEEVASVMEDIVEGVDSYLDYVVENWMEENKVAIESTFRAEIAENFIEAFKALLSEHYVDLPEDRVDVLEELTAKLEELEADLNEAINENVELRSFLAEHEAADTLADVAEGLIPTQADKFLNLAEGVDFTGDIEDYRKRLTIIREQHFGKSKKAASEENTVLAEQTEIDTVDSTPKNVDPTVADYAKGISARFRK
jgi:hypothetical protein